MRDITKPIRSVRDAAPAPRVYQNARGAAVCIAEEVFEVLDEGRWQPGARATAVRDLAHSILQIDGFLGPVCDEAALLHFAPIMAEAADELLAQVRHAIREMEMEVGPADLYLTNPSIQPMLVPAYAIVVSTI